MKYKIWIFCIIVLALINIWWFWPGGLYFLNDDLLHIPLTDNGKLFQTNSVRPLHELLVRLDLQLWGKKAYGYHVTALLLHGIVCIQVYNLCLLMQLNWLKIGRPRAIQASLLAVVLFLVYPQSSESIAWILGRTPVLSAVFLLAAVRLFFTFSFTRAAYFWAAFFFAAALFTYEQSILLPPGLLLIAIAEKEKALQRKMIVFTAALGVAAAGYIIVRKLITSEVVGGYEGGNFISFNWLTLCANVFRIFFRLLLNPAYQKGIIINLVALLIVAAVSFLFLYKKVRLHTFPFIFFSIIILLLIAPVISLGLAVNSFESGRYLYLPSVFLVMGISIAMVSAWYQNTLARPFFTMLLLVFILYWLWGKYTAALQYRNASGYAKAIHGHIERHFANTSDTLFIDTLQLSIYRLPVFRLGFKTGARWLNTNTDTNKIIVKHYYDEVTVVQ